MAPTARRVLLVDNHDSYVGNLLQLIWCETGDRPEVVESDTMDVARIAATPYTHIVLGPGPGTPLNPDDTGGTYTLLRETIAPILGVCFGMQAMAVALGGGIARLPHPAHGVTSTIRLAPSPLFAGLPDSVDVVRYHSLRVPEPPPAPLRPTAWTPDGVLMALESEALGLYGVQFHPESIGTPHGARMVANFLGMPPTAHDRRAACHASPLEVARG